MKKILGMGNALTDILLQIENDQLLNQLNLPKGSMQLIDTAKQNEIHQNINLNRAVMVAGGSASNTINGINKLGVQTGFIGKIANDEIGNFFRNDMESHGVHTHLLVDEKSVSGNCTVLVSPDSERTLCTFLGAAAEMTPEDLSIELFQNYDIFHIEGYLLFNHQLILQAVKLAKQAGLKISIDLASFNVVEANLDFLKVLIADYVDIIFANEEEAKAFTGKEPEEALIHIAEHCDIAVVKIGKNGSFVKSGEVVHNIDPFLADALDTTGAGDLYASGFLYGMAHNLPLEICGKIGSLVSSKVVEVLGAKMTDETWLEIKSYINDLEVD